MATFTVPSLVHPTAVGGNQSDVKVAPLPTGGFVVAWTTDLGGQKDVIVQRFDALGVAVGGLLTANSSLAGDQVLQDIVVTPDGRFTLAWLSGGTATSRSFDGVSGLPTSGEVTSGAATSLQLVAAGAGNYVLIGSSDGATNTTIQQGIFSTNGDTVSAPATITTAASLSTRVLEAVEGNTPGTRFLLLTSVSALSTSLISTSEGTTLDVGVSPPVLDLLKLQDGTHLVGTGTTFSQQISLKGVFGSGPDLGTGYSLGSPVIATDTGGSTSSNRGSFDQALVNLDAGRVLIVWVLDSGDGFTATLNDGVYAGVFNINTGASEGPALRLLNLGVGTNSDILSRLQLSAERMADGRVAVGICLPRGLTGLDTFVSIVDARTSGVTVTGNSRAEKLIGTSFDDRFTSLADGDVVLGGGGVDSVEFAAGPARRIDLANPARFAESTVVLQEIENLSGGAFDDAFYGTNAANVLNGGGGSDRLFGRDGDDSLDGGEGNDGLSGGQGDDHLAGQAGDDILVGGSGSDNLLGGSGLDRLYGLAEADALDGGDNDDFLAGGAGDDNLQGGSGNDVINGGDGDDDIAGGDGNDLIAGGDGFNSIDGGTGIDTATYANSVSPFGTVTGVYADLATGEGPVGNMEGFASNDDILINVENIIGSGGADYLAGNAVANVLRGGAGDDVLVGRGGSNKLFGGTGADVFVMERSLLGSDEVRDFLTGTDHIGLLPDAVGDISPQNIANRFVANATGSPAANTNAQLILKTAGTTAGRLVFDADGNGPGAAFLQATLRFSSATGLSDFNAGDFVFL